MYRLEVSIQIRLATPTGETLIFATIVFRRVSREMSAHLTRDGWTVQETALGDNLTQLFNPSEYDRDSVHRVALEAADTLDGRISFLHHPPTRRTWAVNGSRP